MTLHRQSAMGISARADTKTEQRKHFTCLSFLGSSPNMWSWHQPIAIPQSVMGPSQRCPSDCPYYSMWITADVTHSFLKHKIENLSYHPPCYFLTSSFLDSAVQYLCFSLYLYQISLSSVLQPWYLVSKQVADSFQYSIPAVTLANGSKWAVELIWFGRLASPCGVWRGLRSPHFFGAVTWGLDSIFWSRN